MSETGFAAFHHRATYDAPQGRDRWVVPRVQSWITRTVPAVIGERRGLVVDVGCGEQPFRPLIESCGSRYVGLDVVQNSQGSVDIVASVERIAVPHEPFDVALCTEVLQHLADIDAAFAGLRRLLRVGGHVIATVPFFFPLHMEPYDFRRLTVHGVEQLAKAHGFTVEHADRLGSATDVLTTMLSELSILPTTRSLYSRVKVRGIRLAIASAIRVLGSPMLSSNVNFASNSYLTTGFVLRAT